MLIDMYGWRQWTAGTISTLRHASVILDWHWIHYPPNNFHWMHYPLNIIHWVLHHSKANNSNAVCLSMLVDWREFFVWRIIPWFTVYTDHSIHYILVPGFYQQSLFNHRWSELNKNSVSVAPKWHNFSNQMPFGCIITILLVRTVLVSSPIHLNLWKH